jgi:Ca2+-transporting ATPase
MKNVHHYSGLSSEEVEESRKRHGENLLTPPQKEPIWKMLIEKFADPIIIILLFALILSSLVALYEFYFEGESAKVLLEPAGILVAVLLATTVGFIFELNANKKFELLNKVNDETLVEVIRNGNICQVERKNIVVGDIVILETGKEVPADGELLESISLQINESTLTGEPVARKTADEEQFDANATYPSNTVMMGTTVIDGHGIMKVLTIGDLTEYGKVYQGAQIDSSIKTPLNKQLSRLSSLITKGSYIVAALIFIVRVLFSVNDMSDISQSHFWAEALKSAMLAITIIVVAVPEGLPMSITLSLALSMKRMLTANNLVRKMHACETMGAATYICTDKTGTLTQNQMHIYRTNFYSLNDDQHLSTDEASLLIKEGLAVNSTAYLDCSDPKKVKALGNPTEGALLLWLKDEETDYLSIRENAEITEQLTFSTERKFMATTVISPLLNKKVLYVKGAPEIVFSLCKTVLAGKMLTPKEEYEKQVFEQLEAYQAKAMRTLGFAYKIIGDDDKCIQDGALETTELTFLGIAAISDPIREDVPAAVKECIDAGIGIKIITGDTPGTAKEIGRQIGLWGENEPESNHLTGAEFAAMPDSELRNRVQGLKILSRARPMDKQRLVNLLHEWEEVIAMTGDGTNDAPALNVADVGISMGDGTSVAKEASDITILDNSFTSISRAVMWGRSLYKNIQRFILFQMTINVAACLIVLISAFVTTRLPLTVTQMLWVNLIMDTFAAMALASLPPSKNVMKDKPRAIGSHIITRKMAFTILGAGLAFLAILFGVLQYFQYNEVATLTDFRAVDLFKSYFCFGKDSLLTPYELSMFFTFFVMLQFWNLFNAKAFMSGQSAFSNILRAPGFLLIAGIILVGQYLITYFGGEMFNVVPLTPVDFLLITAVTSVVLWFGEISRLISTIIPGRKSAASRAA